MFDEIAKQKSEISGVKYRPLSLVEKSELIKRVKNVNHSTEVWSINFGGVNNHQTCPPNLS